MTANNTNIAPAKYRLGGPTAWWVWILVTVFTIYLFNVQTMFSVVQGDIKSALSLDESHLTLIAGTYTWAFAIFQFFGGAFLDCFGSRKVLIPAFIFVTAGVFLYGLATSYTVILLAQVLMALGACCGFVGAGYIGGVWFGMAAYGTMFGYVQVLSSLSSAIQQPITEGLLAHLTYEKLFIYLGFFGVLLVVLAILYMRNPTPVVTKKDPFKVVADNLKQIVKMPQMWIAAMWGGIVFGLNLALGVVWTPKLFTEAGYTLDNGNLGSALLWLGLAVGLMFLAPVEQQDTQPPHTQHNRSPAHDNRPCGCNLYKDAGMAYGDNDVCNRYGEPRPICWHSVSAATLQAVRWWELQALFSTASCLYSEAYSRTYHLRSTATVAAFTGCLPPTSSPL